MRRTVVISLAIAALLAAAAASVSCQSDNALMLVSQEEAIDKYINSKYADYEVVRNEGANRVIVIEGDPSRTAAPGDSLTIYAEGHIFNGSPSVQFLAQEATVELGPADLVKGLERGLEGVKEGEECYIFFSARYGYYDSPMGLVPPMSALMFHVIVSKITKK